MIKNKMEAFTIVEFIIKSYWICKSISISKIIPQQVEISKRGENYEEENLAPIDFSGNAFSINYYGMY